MLKEYHPPHIYQDDTFYFITAKTKGGEDTFYTKQRCDIFFEVFKTGLEKFEYEAVGWTLNSDHYHILISVSEGGMLGKYVNNLHSNTSRLINKHDHPEGKQIWYQYWDRCIRSERDLYTRLNYIHHNPVKHGYVSKMEDYEYSSYKWYLKNKGEEWLNDCFERYPIRDFSLDEGD